MYACFLVFLSLLDGIFVIIETIISYISTLKLSYNSCRFNWISNLTVSKDS